MRLFKRPETTVLLVCTANICRSPMAEGLLRLELRRRGLQHRVGVDSAGTHATQAGRRPDPRAQAICEQNGIEIGKIRARQIRQGEFESLDHILAMDGRNQKWLLEQCPAPYRHKIAMISGWAIGSGIVDIPDPYYGNQEGFAQVFAVLQTALDGFVSAVLEPAMGDKTIVKPMPAQ